MVNTGVLWLLFFLQVFSLDVCVSSFCPLLHHLPFCCSLSLIIPLFSVTTFLQLPALNWGGAQERSEDKRPRDFGVRVTVPHSGRLDLPISDEIPGIPNIRRNLSTSLISKPLILWMRKLNHREDLPWPPHLVGQAWARVQVSWSPIQEKRRPTPCSHLSQELLPSQSTSLTFLLTCGNIKLYQDFNHSGFSSVYNKMLSPGTSIEIILINNTYCLPFEDLLFSKQCLINFFFLFCLLKFYTYSNRINVRLLSQSKLKQKKNRNEFF